MSQKKKGHSVQTGAKIKAVISWDEGKADAKDFDLDLSAVIFNGKGNYVETVYFGQLESRNKGCVHIGDSNTGQDEESISIDTQKLSHDTGCIVLVVNSYNGHDFSKIETGELRVDVGGKTLISSFLGRHGHTTAFVVCRLVRRGAAWSLDPLEVATYGRCFADTIPDIQTEIQDLYPNMQFLRKGEVMVMQKGEVIDLGKDYKGSKLSRVIVGLGWDPARSSSNIDLDGSVLLFDGQQRQTEVVYFSNLRSSCGSISHKGDNLTGEGEGDDEQIVIDLGRVPKRHANIVVVVTSYNNDRLQTVRNAFMRLVDCNTNKEIMRFDLAGGSNNNDTAMLMCRFYRNADAGWQLKTIGFTCRARMAKACAPLALQEIRGRRSNPGHELRVQAPGTQSSAAAAPSRYTQRSPVPPQASAPARGRPTRAPATRAPSTRAPSTRGQHATPSPFMRKEVVAVLLVVIAMLCAVFFGNGSGGVPQRHR